MLMLISFPAIVTEWDVLDLQAFSLRNEVLSDPHVTRRATRQRGQLSGFW